MIVDVTAENGIILVALAVVGGGIVHGLVREAILWFQCRDRAKLDHWRRRAMAHRLYRPAGFDAPGARFPLVVHLHGDGARGTDAATSESPAPTEAIGGLLNITRPGGRYPAYVLLPQVPGPNTPGYSADDDQPRYVNVPFSTGSYTNANAPAQSTWSKLTSRLIDQVVGGNGVDARRVYVTGLSLGGYGAWDLLARRPGTFAAAVPMSGGANTDTAGAIKGVPI